MPTQTSARNCSYSGSVMALTSLTAGAIKMLVLLKSIESKSTFEGRKVSINPSSISGHLHRSIVDHQTRSLSVIGGLHGTCVHGVCVLGVIVTGRVRLHDTTIVKCLPATCDSPRFHCCRSLPLRLLQHVLDSHAVACFVRI